MSDTTHLARAGFLTATIPSEPSERQAWDRMVAAALYTPNVFTFTRAASDTITVHLGYAVYDRGIHYVAYRVVFSATGETYKGLDYVRDMHTPVRNHDAATTLLYLLGCTIGDDALCEFSEVCKANDALSPSA